MPHEMNIYRTFREYHLHYELWLTGISCVLNGTLIYLVLTTRNSVMRSYGWIVLMSVAGDLIYTFVNIVTMEVVEVKGGVSFFITLGPFEHTGYPYNFLMASLFLGALYTTVFTLGMQFVYRYFALCRNPLTVAEFAGMYFSGVFSMFAIALLSFFAFRDMSEEDTELLKGHPAYTYDTPIYMAVDPGSVHSRLHIAFSQSTVICVYAVIIYTGRKINAKLRDVSTDMSESTRAAHKQLNKVMIIQASYPAVVLGLPILVATLCIQLRVDVLWAGLYLVPSASLIPMANAITVMLVIPSFRNRLLGKLQKSGKIKGVSGSKAFSTELKPNMSSML